MSRSVPSAANEVARGISCFRDTCNVYVLRSGRDAVLVDFGSGAVADHLPEIGVTRVTDVLVTHHHRDQVQGLARAVAAGARIWVPPVEAELIADVDAHWQRRPLDVDYDLREDRFSLLESVAVTGMVPEYRTRRFGGYDVYTLPTPGHTPGSVTYLVEADGRTFAFTGDLVHGDGGLWSLAATQWTYTGVEGQEATIVSCATLARQAPDVLLPSHGGPIEDVAGTLARVRARLGDLVALRLEEPYALEDRLAHPFEVVTPHLLRNRTTSANSYLLLSENGDALGIDFGYDLAAGRRPLLWSLEGKRVEAVVTTHYHDDHVAGLNLLRAVHGTAVWAPESVAPVLEEPTRYDLPCLWPEPIRVDRALPLDTPFSWREYELTLHAFPGHTRYAAAVAVDVDGRRIVATGDQYTPLRLNYQYRNRFRRRDFVHSAELLRTLRPDVLIGGHFWPFEVTDDYLDRLLAEGERVAELHDELLPEEGFGEDGFGARIEPYRSTVRRGESVELDVAVLNPFGRAETAYVALVVPPGWEAEPTRQEVELAPHGEATIVFRATPGEAAARSARARVAADLTVGHVPFGQQAEALVGVE